MKKIQYQGVDMSNEFGDEADEAIIKLLVVCNNNIVSMIMMNELYGVTISNEIQNIVHGLSL